MNKILRKIFNNPPAVLIFLIIFAFVLGEFIPYNVKSFFYSVSLTIKEILVFLLPVIIFAYVSSAILSFSTGVVRFILVLIFCVCISNFLSTQVGYFVSKLTLPLTGNIESGIEISKILNPLWDFTLPKIISNDLSLVFGFATGILLSIYPNEKTIIFVNKIKHLVDIFLEKIFINILPLFIFGFVCKLEYEEIIETLIKRYSLILLVMVCTFIIYLSMLYLIAANFKFSKFSFYIKNILPATLTGLSTMSSAAAMPVSIKAAEKNIGNTQLARAIIPSTVNIHMIGDGIGIPMMAIIMLSAFGYGFPTWESFAIFGFYFVITKFAAAAIPGGTIIVMIPVLESRLGFTSDMSALMTAFYILLDPIITATSVTGNGVFAIFQSKIAGVLGLNNKN